MNNKIEKLYELVNGIDYNREIPKKAEKFAKENGFVVIVGGSDDLMYCYGAESYLTDYCEHGYGWDGDLLVDISDIQLKDEASQLGLEIYWCGKIFDNEMKVLKEKENYDTKTMGAFSYKVKNGINFKDFTVYENLEKNGKEDVYCTGIIIELPEDFKPSLNNKEKSA